MGERGELSTFEGGLEQHNIGKDAEERKAMAREQFDVIKDGLEAAFRSAPPSVSSVRHITMKKSARLPFDVNHLWPLITHSSPSSRAVVRIRVGSEPATSGSVRPTEG